MDCSNWRNEDWGNCLRELGCDEATVAQFARAQADNDKEAAIRLLSRHRCHLLCLIHEAEKPLNCLDYMLHQLKKCGSDEGNK